MGCILVISSLPQRSRAITSSIDLPEYVVVRACNLSEAKDLFQEAHAALIVLDIESDFSVLSKVNDLFRPLPLILAIGKLYGNHAIANALDEGADAYISYPVDPELLFSEVRALLRRTGNG